MAKPFDDFLAEFRTALRSGNQEFVRAVYQDWVDTSGALPPEYRDTFPELVLAEVGPLAELEAKDVETFDDFGIVRFSDPANPDETTSLTFRQKDDGWVMWNERSGFVAFSNVYTLWYSVTGGRVAVRFNGRRSPLLSEPDEDTASAVLSPLNASLRVGPNTVRLVHVGGAPEVIVRIGSAKEGEIADSSVGDVLLWEGTVTEDVELSFDAG